ncbi:hypothetical protein Cadr_000022562 [Camelus dromedarius]|uniref:Uncharacterized protein n=1 Tax=Camelus dromedarius TaxID=9838 RepID=A0A5N4CG15_CAMDR|nr:hypothetical protein Cadr_000022562 [Camelus dromedarius]KAB1257856.1 hypothetical protein Cadr_000022562 [Camelus dromedarius]
MRKNISLGFVQLALILPSSPQPCNNSCEKQQPTVAAEAEWVWNYPTSHPQRTVTMWPVWALTESRLQNLSSFGLTQRSLCVKSQRLVRLAKTVGGKRLTSQLLEAGLLAASMISFPIFFLIG